VSSRNPANAPTSRNSSLTHEKIAPEFIATTSNQPKTATKGVKTFAPMAGGFGAAAAQVWEDWGRRDLTGWDEIGRTSLSFVVGTDVFAVESIGALACVGFEAVCVIVVGAWLSKFWSDNKERVFHDAGLD
jgi:hypothetical protein